MNFDENNSDLILNLETILRSYLPAIKKADEWKKFHQLNENSDHIKFHLIYQIEQNTNFFQTLHISFNNCIQLEKVPIRLNDDKQDILHPNTLRHFAQDNELIQQAEQTMTEWIKQIQNVRINRVKQNNPGSWSA